MKLRNLVVILMAGIQPVSLLAQQTAEAMLRASGKGIFLNGGPAPPSAALFANDLVQTPKEAVARIEAPGSATDINAETVVQFHSDELALDHGSLSLLTSRGLRVRVGCLTITPVNPFSETLYEVVDMDGKVTVHATRSDVYIDARSSNPSEVKKSNAESRDLVRESEQKSRDEKCGGAYMNAATNPPGVGAILNSRIAILLGTAGVAVGTCIGLCTDDDPISPYKP